MKKIYIVFLLSLAVTAASAQDYKKFKVGLGGGLASGLGSNLAPLITFEPAYRISDDLAIGLRIEATTEFTSEASIGSFALNSQYYFSENKFRLFVGGGLGLYYFQSRGYSAPGKFGFYPRIGFDVGHFSLLLDGNLYEKITGYKYFNRYLGLKICVFVGGGKK
jgi:hypothetical protein